MTNSIQASNYAQDPRKMMTITELCSNQSVRGNLGKAISGMVEAETLLVEGSGE